MNWVVRIRDDKYDATTYRDTDMCNMAHLSAL